jgi:molybdenum cofactor cytidylyltransferase
MAAEHISSNGPVAGVLLAAGRSTRFGGNKLCHPLADGVPVGLRSAQNLRAGLGSVLAVLRVEDAMLRARLDAAGIEWVVCPDAGEGMAATIACGVTATRGAGGWVIALADMPFIEPRTIAAVGTAVANGAVLAAPFFRGTRGHPVGFAPSLRDELLSLSGDEGARRVISRHAEHLQRIDCDDSGILADIDMPADLHR